MDKMDQMMIGIESYSEVLSEKMAQTTDPDEKARLLQSFLTALQTDFFKTGDYWTHYKGGVYMFLTLAIKEDTLQPLVVYQSLKHGTIWVRSLVNFLDSVELPDGSKTFRFKFGAP